MVWPGSRVVIWQWNRSRVGVGRSKTSLLNPVFVCLGARSSHRITPEAIFAAPADAAFGAGIEVENGAGASAAAAGMGPAAMQTAASRAARASPLRGGGGAEGMRVR